MNRLPEVYYQRRRAAAVVAIVVLAVLIVLLTTMLRGGSSDEDAGTVAQTETVITTTTTPAAETSAPSGEAGESGGSGEAGESGAATSEAATTTVRASGKCGLADLEIRAFSDKPDYESGDTPQFFMEVHNPTDTDCVIDLDEDELRFEVYNLGSYEKLWTDTDCNDPVIHGKETFKAGESRNFKATWSRSTSAPERCSERERVPAGSYLLHTVIGDNASGPLTFNLK